jgi:shikimate kinase
MAPGAAVTLVWKLEDDPCISLVGMAGAGKSTLGRRLADRLGWAHMDTDRLVEAHWGQGLQELLDERGPEEFLAAEEAAVAGLSVKRCVVSTGGSVVYSRRIVSRLKSLGPVVYLRIDLETFLRRVGPAADRGFVVRTGCAGLEDVYAERQPLYEAAADVTVDTGRRNVDASVEVILEAFGAGRPGRTAPPQP